jgi:hypothetical protein
VIRRPSKTDLRLWRAALLGATLALVFASSVARAQAASCSGIAAITPELATTRYYAGSDASAENHLYDFSPEAINYLDCENNVAIDFTIDLSDAPAGDEIQVWAGEGPSTDCTVESARTAGANGGVGSFPGRCWPVAPFTAFSTSGSTASARVNVQDLVAYLGEPNPPVDYTPASGTVCRPYATNGPVELRIYFIFVPTGGKTAAPVDGCAGRYITAAALVGPFAPVDVSIPGTATTATTLTVSWSPQSEATIQGYNIYVQDEGVNAVNTGVVSTVDAGPTTTSTVSCRVPNTCTPVTIHDAGRRDAGGSQDAGKGDAEAHDADLLDANDDADASDDAGGSDASETCDAGLSDAEAPVDAAAYADASDADLAAAGCVRGTTTIGVGMEDSSVPQTCVSGVLTNVFTVDGGLGSTATASDAATGVVNPSVTTGDASDDAAAITAGDTGSTTIPGSSVSTTESAGISNIPNQYFLIYQAGSTASTYTLTGLITGHTYAVGVAAVDAYGNVGPVGVACSTPTVVDDFFTAYSQDGGMAGGGFCALSAVGAPACGSAFGLTMLGAGFMRARRRRRQGARR